VESFHCCDKARQFAGQYVVVAYAIVAWLLVQAGSIPFPTFEAPPWVMEVFVTAVILGFPVALT